LCGLMSMLPPSEPDNYEVVAVDSIESNPASVEDGPPQTKAASTRRRSAIILAIAPPSQAGNGEVVAVDLASVEDGLPQTKAASTRWKRKTPIIKTIILVITIVSLCLLAWWLESWR